MTEKECRVTSETRLRCGGLTRGQGRSENGPGACDGVSREIEGESNSSPVRLITVGNDRESAPTEESSGCSESVGFTRSEDEDERVTPLAVNSETRRGDVSTSKAVTPEEELSQEWQHSKAESENQR